MKTIATKPKTLAVSRETVSSLRVRASVRTGQDQSQPPKCAKANDE
jgi:hypothetical protein